MEILRLLRGGAFSSVEVVLRDGEIRSIRTTTEVAVSGERDVLRLRLSEDYQTVRVTKRDGGIVSVTQEIPRPNGVRRQ